MLLVHFPTQGSEGVSCPNEFSMKNNKAKVARIVFGNLARIILLAVNKLHPTGWTCNGVLF